MLRQLVSVAATLTLFGCADAPYVWVESVESSAGKQAGFIIIPGDTLVISVYNDNSISGTTRVRSDGYITMQLLGDVLAAGKNPAALAQELQAGLSKFLTSPTVAVRVESEGQIRVTLIGEVSEQGVVELPRGSGILTAIATGGGLSEYAGYDRIFVIRQNPRVRIRFDFDDLVANDPQAMGFQLLNGDIVYVE